MTNRSAVQAALAALSPPGVEAHHVEFIGEGYSSIIFRVPDAMVVRVPTSAPAARRDRIVAHLLPRIASRLPFGVPVPLRSFGPAAGLPWGAVVYRYLPGEPLANGCMDRSLTRRVGAGLAAIHAIEPADAGIDATILPHREQVQHRREAVMDIVLPYLRDTQATAAATCVARWWDTYRQAWTGWRYAPALVHGDFWSGNLLVAPGEARVTGVLDWEDAAYDDPAQDFATLLHSGPAFAALAQDGYVAVGGTIDDLLLARRDWHWAYRECTGLAAALAAHDDAEALDALHKLQAGGLRHCFENDR